MWLKQYREKREIKRIIKIVLTNRFPSFPSNHELTILKTCCQKGYLIDVNFAVWGDGRNVVDTNKAKITEIGKEYLHPNQAIRRSNVAIIISILALLVSFLSNLEKIVSALSYIKDLLR